MFDMKFRGQTLSKWNICNTIGKLSKIRYLKRSYIFIWNYELNILKKRKVGSLKRGLSWFLPQRWGELPSPLRRKRLSSPKSNFPNVWQNNLGGIHCSNQTFFNAIGKLSKMRYLKLFYIFDLAIWAKIYDEKKVGCQISKCPYL
jgi:hypothetical protein